MQEAEVLLVRPSLSGGGGRRYSNPLVPRWKVPCANVWRTLMLLVILTTLLWQHGFFTTSVAIVEPPRNKTSGAHSFVMHYAPLVWLDIGEQYFPSDISAQIDNSHPVHFPNTSIPLDYTLNMSNLDTLNTYGDDVHLMSNTDVTKNPYWLKGVAPDSIHRAGSTKSCAIIIVDHGAGSVDVFYMYFYAYNLGNAVFFQELGNHVGDWEHNMIRFRGGVPTEVWFSQHSNGEAFKYAAVEKKDRRVVSYSARGSHALYATPGTHDHTVPNLNLAHGLLQDYTSQGSLWDPTLNAYIYNYNTTTSTFTSASDGFESPVGAMNFRGKWGDPQFQDGDERQRDFLGFKKFASGPTGPWDKYLDRKTVCPENGLRCVVRSRPGV